MFLSSFSSTRVLVNSTHASMSCCSVNDLVPRFDGWSILESLPGVSCFLSKEVMEIPILFVELDFLTLVEGAGADVVAVASTGVGEVVVAGVVAVVVVAVAGFADAGACGATFSVAAWFLAIGSMAFFFSALSVCSPSGEDNWHNLISASSNNNRLFLLSR